MQQGCTQSGCQVVQAVQICTVTQNIAGSSVWNLFHVSLLAPRVSRFLLDFWKICAPLQCTAVHLTAFY